MAQLDFYNHNIHRAYPLVDAEAADNYWKYLAFLRVIVRPNVGYDPSSHDFFLYGIRKLAANTVGADGTFFVAGTYFVFTSSAPALAGYAFVASVVSNTKYARGTFNVMSKSSAFQLLGQTYPVSIVENHLVEGVIVAGDLYDMPSDVTLVPSSPLRVEPALVIPAPEYATGSGTGTVYVYNKKRTVYTPDSVCSQIPTDVSDLPAYVLQCYTTGPVRLAGGFSTLVDQSIQLGTITVDAKAGAGVRGYPCDQVPLPGEELPDTSSGYDAALTCQEVLRSVNGAQGPHMTISAKDGVQIAAYPQLSRLVIGIDGHGINACATFDSSEAVECLPYANNLICGENNVAMPCPPTPDSGVGYADQSFLDSITQFPGTKTIWNRVGGGENSYQFTVPNCGTPCRWVESGGVWELDSYGCVSPCNCTEPNRPPLVGETVTTPCGEMSADLYNVRNADFVAEPEALAGWDVYGDVTVISSHPAIDNSDLPMAKLVSTSVSTAQLRQRYLHLTRGKVYKIVLDAFVEAGQLTVTVVENGAVAYQKTVSQNGGVEAVELLGYIPRVSTPDVIIAAKPLATAVATINFARLGFIKLS